MIKAVSKAYEDVSSFHCKIVKASQMTDKNVISIIFKNASNPESQILSHVILIEPKN